MPGELDVEAFKELGEGVGTMSIVHHEHINFSCAGKEYH